MSRINRQLRLKSRPEGLVKREDFDLQEHPVGELKDGEVLVRVLYLSMDPTNRVWMSDIPQYMPPVGLPAASPPTGKSAGAKEITGVASESPVTPGKPTLEANPDCAGTNQICTVREYPYVVCSNTVGENV